MRLDAEQVLRPSDLDLDDNEQLARFRTDGRGLRPLDPSRSPYSPPAVEERAAVAKEAGIPAGGMYPFPRPNAGWSWKRPAVTRF